MRCRYVVNGILCCCNTLLFLLLLVMFLGHRGELPWDPFIRKAESDAVKMGMDVWFAKFPFALFVARDSPKGESFTLLKYDPPVIFSADKIEGESIGTGKHSIMLHLGEDFSIVIHFSASEADISEIHELELVKDNERQRVALFDMNADGWPDFRIVRDKTLDTSQEYVSYERDWREVKDTIGKYEKKLVDGEEVVFDMQAGQWRSNLCNTAEPGERDGESVGPGGGGEEPH
jgi:hypothetical protein